MSKLDLIKENKPFYTCKTIPNIINIPPANFLTIDGRGEPGSDIYQDKVSALYAVAYRIKFMAKDAGQDFVVCKLEGLWWFDSHDELPPPREEWNWTMMIRQPDFVTEDMVSSARQVSFEKKKLDDILEVKFENYHEGLSAQIMHLGPYSQEGPTIKQLHNFVESESYRLRNKHHEIYMKGPPRTDPAKYLTIIRHPVEKTK